MPNQNQSSLQQSNLIDRLRNRISKVETAGRIDDGIRVSSGCTAIDRLLPGNGYQRGTLVQWLTGGGQAADYLSLLLAREACEDGGALVVFDPLNQFYPPAAAAIGINLDNLIILHTEQLANPAENRQEDLLWSIDQSLRCPGVAAVWGPLDHIDERWFRRFQLSAESSGCLGLFVQPISESCQPSWAEVQWWVSAAQRSQINPQDNLSQRERISPPSAMPPSAANPNRSRNQLVRLQLTRCRGTQTGKTVNLSINTITGNVHLARRDHEQSFSENRADHPATARNGALEPRKIPSTGTDGTLPRPDAIAQNPLSLVSQLAHPTTGRQRA
jgi:hypothetical protein